MKAAKPAASHGKRGAPRGKQAAAGRTGRWARVRQMAINAFLVFHLLAITCWAVPFANPLTTLCRNAVRPYFQWVGLFQSWDMFSPSPKIINSYVDAIVLYTDGNTRNWAFPRMELLNLKDRYFKERYRKYVENLKDDKNAALWPDAARFIARANNDRPVPIRMVLLARHWSEIVVGKDGSARRAPWDDQVFYAYTLVPGDLK